MALEPAITDIEKLKDNPALALLLGWRQDAVESAKWDREELSIVLRREALREACALLRDDPRTNFNFLADITCVDWYPSEPRFEVVYNLLSIPRKDRVRIKVRL
ncbi:MAG: NADH-quinone oxidoreductase subunit C, partial [Acidobacteriaceae bacterium]